MVTIYLLLYHARQTSSASDFYQATHNFPGCHYHLLAPTTERRQGILSTLAPQKKTKGIVIDILIRWVIYGTDTYLEISGDQKAI